MKTRLEKLTSILTKLIIARDNARQLISLLNNLTYTPYIESFEMPESSAKAITYKYMNLKERLERLEPALIRQIDRTMHMVNVQGYLDNSTTTTKLQGVKVIRIRKFEDLKLNVLENNLPFYYSNSLHTISNKQHLIDNAIDYIKDKYDIDLYSKEEMTISE